MKRAVAGLVGLLMAGSAFADVAVIESGRLARIRATEKLRHSGHRRDRALIKSFGDKELVDAAGVQYFINTDLPFSTTFSGSGAATEANFTGPVNADTSGGGSVSATLTDAYDGYNSLCVSFTGAVGPCVASDVANYTLYTQNGQASLDCNDRQVINPPQTIGSIQVQRKIFVPDNDQFARWVNIFTNTGGGSQSVTAVIANNLGSQENTTIFGSSNGNTTAELTDSWVATDGNFTGMDANDPRLGHVLQGPGARTPVSSVTFPVGASSDFPTWAYNFTLAPGETKIIVNYGVVQPTRAAALAKSAALAGLGGAALDCLTPAERSNIVNFEARGVTEIPTASGFGLAALALLLAGASFFALRRRTV
ncbi:MAG: hypothetical protein ABJC13_13780 [Acidobacteriota bacterium]